MFKLIKFFLGIFLIASGSGIAQMASTPPEETKTIYIEADSSSVLPTPEDVSKDVMSTPPFFAVSSSGNEAMEEIEKLKARVKALEKNSLGRSDDNMNIKSEGALVIEAKGDIEVITPGEIKLKAKNVEIPVSRKP